MKEPKPIEGLLGDVYTGKEKVPAQVEVLDCKYGNVIGYRPRKEVRQLLLEDVRFVGNVSSEGVVQLIYSPSAALAGMTVMCDTLGLYIKYIRAHLKTAVSCDDALRKWLQVTFLHNGRSCVVALPLNEFTFDEMARSCPGLVKALGHCTTGLIKYLKGHPDTPIRVGDKVELQGMLPRFCLSTGMRGLVKRVFPKKRTCRVEFPEKSGRSSFELPFDKLTAVKEEAKPAKTNGRKVFRNGRQWTVFKKPRKRL